MPEWVAAVKEEDLQEEKIKVVSAGNKQIALIIGSSEIIS